MRASLIALLALATLTLGLTTAALAQPPEGVPPSTPVEDAPPVSVPDGEVTTGQPEDVPPVEVPPADTPVGPAEHNGDHEQGPPTDVVDNVLSQIHENWSAFWAALIVVRDCDAADCSDEAADLAAAAEGLGNGNGPVGLARGFSIR